MDQTELLNSIKYTNSGEFRVPKFKRTLSVHQMLNRFANSKHIPAQVVADRLIELAPELADVIQQQLENLDT